MTRKMPDFHETWMTAIDCPETKRPHLEEMHARLEGRGLYESYDAEKRLIRCGLLPQVIRGVTAITAWPNEVNWIIRIPYTTQPSEDYWMRIYKQTLKRHHHSKMKTKDKK